MNIMNDHLRRYKKRALFQQMCQKVLELIWSDVLTGCSKVAVASNGYRHGFVLRDGSDNFITYDLCEVRGKEL